MSSNDRTIIHPGIIEKVEKDKIFVKILSQSACSTCHAKSVCMVSEVEEKIVEVGNEQPDKWKPGDQVNVHMEKSLGTKAVFLGYMLPLIILVLSLIILLSLMHDEGLAAIISILILFHYYLVLYLIKDKLSRTFSFHIEEI